MENPLEQFAIKKIIPWQIGDLDLSFTNSSLCMVVTVLFIVLTMSLCLRSRAVVPTKAQAAAESVYDFIHGIIGETLGRDGLKYFSLIFALFTFIAVGNMMGLLPYSFTFTSHIAAVGTLSVLFLILNIYFGIKHRGIRYLHTFFPEGLPWIMAPLIVPVETLSLLAKPFSLTIRLAVNMSVGHIMLEVIGTFILAMGLFGFIPLVADMCIIMFELFITLLQAYIYTTLSCVYLSQSISDEE
jgi:F-type H+-transporting ATPase subunit a